MTASPVTDSAARAYGSRSTSPFRPSASRRAAIDAWSFFRGRRFWEATAALSRNLPAVSAHIIPAKDIDGITPINAGRLYLGRPTLVPGTPLGIMRMLAEYDIETTGARAVVVGRSNIVGKPMAHLLLQANATVTICHSRTDDLQRHTLGADILVAAVGQLHIVGADMVKAGSTVIDVGMNRTDEGLFGDVDPDA